MRVPHVRCHGTLLLRIKVVSSTGRAWQMISWPWGAQTSLRGSPAPQAFSGSNTKPNKQYQGKQLPDVCIPRQFSRLYPCFEPGSQNTRSQSRRGAQPPKVLASGWEGDSPITQLLPAPYTVRVLVGDQTRVPTCCSKVHLLHFNVAIVVLSHVMLCHGSRAILIISTKHA